ncbi:MAG TPA: PocR ligand-binding domain-containing protein [Deltaproteobacteria bacterium]|nr:PocR ligand-binding domain-containing protein [Deltaproteobacteria bacterium]
MKHSFSELVDVKRIQELADLFYKATGIPSAVIDPDGIVITGSGWQPICTAFHRVHPEARDRCIESDTVIANQIESGRKYTVYRCRNGLIDAATPILIEGEHVANLFTGQFLFTPPDPDFFREQARRFGFDEDEYLDAAANIPVIDEEKLLPILDYLAALAEVVGDMGIRRIRHREIEQALRESREDLNRAQAVAHTGSWRLNVLRNELLWSDETYRIFGIPQGTAMTYERFLDSIHPDDREYVDLKWNEAMRGEPYDIDHRIIVGDTVKWVREQAELEFDRDGKLLGGFGTVQDITSRKRVENELMRYREQLEGLVRERTSELEEKNRKLGEEIAERKKAEEEKERVEAQLLQSQKIEALGNFAGGIAHDLNNILYPIVINTEALLDVAAPGTQDHEMLSQTLEAAYRQRDLVKQILSFSRKSIQKLSPVEVTPILESTLRFVRSTLPSTIEIRHRIDVSHDTIMGDPTQVQQVIMNLCKNAADAMDAQKGAIEVRLSDACLEGDHALPDLSPGEYLELSVQDNGHGIPPELIDRVFDPFFTTKSVGKGSGMGLSVVHGIVKRLGGTITVTSRVGKGSRFVVYLPLCDHGSGTHETDRDDQDASRKNILLIDDEEAVVATLERALKRMGYDVRAFMSPREALDLFCENPEAFDLVISDMTMPRMTGVELGKRIMETRPGIPVILCTGFSDLIDEQGAKDMGFSGLLAKPSGTCELRAAVQQALES